MNEIAKTKVARSAVIKNWIVLLLAVGVTLLSTITAFAQKKPSDSEMQEVFRQLLEREVQRSVDGSDVAVLLGPNVNSAWIPRVQGLSIRQLNYDEQKQVPEYYDINWQLKGGGIEAQLVKGNYCRKAGRRYEFRRKSGAWDAKPIGFVESNTGGEICPGCTLGSGATYSVENQFPSSRFPVPTPRMRSASTTDSLRLTGEVRSTTCLKDKNYIQCKTGLMLTFTNVSDTPVIILQPHGEYELWHGATTLALSENDSRNGSFVYASGGWPSIYRFPIYRELADLLDQPTPPDGVTRTLPAGDSWSWNTSITVSVQERNSCNEHVGVEAGWQEIHELSPPLWLRVSYEMWPFNVENFKPNLGGMLKQRWASFGTLYLEEKTDRHWHASITSEPIEFHLNRVPLNQP